MVSHLPVIGVIACTRDVEGEPVQSVKHRYLEAISRHAGAIPLIIPANQAPAAAAVLVRRLDAILLTGSNSNISPARFGSTAPQRQPVNDNRDGFSIAMIHAAIAAGVPLLGVCRGLQEVNVALGGSLRDLRDGGPAGSHHAPPDAALAEMFGFGHDVNRVAGSLLASITGPGPLAVNSVHYQAIDKLGEGLAVDATAADGVIEAVHATSTRAPLLAVQWHPEWRPENRPGDLALWHWLGTAARAHRTQLEPIP